MALSKEATQQLCDMFMESAVKASKTLFDAMIASRDARIAQLEADIQTLRALLDAKMEEPR